MAPDTTYITTAAAHFDGYARALREHARTLTAADGVRWVSASANDFRAVLAPVAQRLGTLAGDAEQAARSLRAHATAVSSSATATLVDQGVQTGTRIVATVAAPVVADVREARSWLD